MNLLRALVATLGILSGTAWAGGMSMHMFQSEKAFKALEAGELKTLLTTHRDAWVTGTQYPDAGYAPGFLKQPQHVWGEASHWSPFIKQYLGIVKERCQGRYLSDAECGRMTAHLLGSAAHGLQDQVFDSLFIPKVTEVDRRGQESTDTGLDMVLLREHDRRDFVPKQWYVPAGVLEEVYRRMGYSPAEANARQIRQATQISALGNRGSRVVAPLLYFHYKAMMPWGSRNYMKHPGGVEFGGKVTANLWRHLWRKLNDLPHPAQAGVTLLPEANATNVATDKRNTDMQISITFDRHIVPYTVNRESFRVVDEQGRRIAGRVGLFAGEGERVAQANMIYFRPDEILQHDTRYTVIMTSTILDEEGHSVFGLDGFSWQFRTEKAERYVQMRHQGLCLGLAAHDPQATSLPLELHDCRVTRHQHWFEDTLGRLHNRERPDLCLQPLSANVSASVSLRAVRCGESAAQQWKTGTATAHLSPAGDTRLAAGTFLQAWKGIEVQLLPAANDPRRQWSLEPVGVDYSCPDTRVYEVCW